jgi:hypothetical protein
MNTKTESFFADRLAIGIAVLGIALMATSLHYNVNPACAGALRGGIQDHPVALWVLVVTTVPAMLVGTLIWAIPDPDISAPWVNYVSVFACQAFLFFALGKAAGGCLRSLRRVIEKKRSPTTASTATNGPAAGGPI